MIYPAQSNGFIELTLSMSVRRITVQSVNVINLPQNGTMINPAQINGFIELTLSMGVRGITVWSVSVIDLPQNGTMRYPAQHNEFIDPCYQWMSGGYLSGQ